MKFTGLRKRAPAKDSEIAALSAAAADMKATEDDEAAYIAEKNEMDAAVDASMVAKDRAKQDIVRLEAEAARLVQVSGGDEFKQVAAQLQAANAVVGVHDHIIRVTQAKLRSFEHEDRHSKYQARRYETRRLFFRALRDMLVAQIPEETLEIIADAQIASAQADDRLNFGPFCDTFLRTNESRQTDANNTTALADYAQRLIQEYSAQ